MDLKEEDILGDSIAQHWYYVAKGRALRQFLGGIRAPEVLDVGAGSGVFSRLLLAHDVCGSAVCVDPNYPSERSDTHGGKPIRFVRSIERTTQKLLLMMDVLEHTSDDVGLLRSYTATMPPEASVMITVPAFQFLWSGHDVFLEHHRRYTIQAIEDVVRRAGLEVMRSRYFFGALFPLVAFARVLKRSRNDAPKSELQVYPHWLNATLISIHDLERVSLFRLNRAFGLSVFCLCRGKGAKALARV